MNKKRKVHSLTGRITLPAMNQAFKAVKRKLRLLGNLAVRDWVAQEVTPGSALRTGVLTMRVLDTSQSVAVANGSSRGGKWRNGTSCAWSRSFTLLATVGARGADARVSAEVQSQSARTYRFVNATWTNTSSRDSTELSGRRRSSILPQIRLAHTGGILHNSGPTWRST